MIFWGKPEELLGWPGYSYTTLHQPLVWSGSASLVRAPVPPEVRGVNLHARQCVDSRDRR